MSMPRILSQHLYIMLMSFALSVLSYEAWAGSIIDIGSVTDRAGEPIQGAGLFC